MKKIVVVGGGTMGLDIAHTFARSGHAVVVREISDELAEKSHSRLVAALDKLVARGKMLSLIHILYRTPRKKTTRSAQFPLDAALSLCYSDTTCEKGLFCSAHFYGVCAGTPPPSLGTQGGNRRLPP